MIKFKFFGGAAGLFTMEITKDNKIFDIHFIVKKKQRQWGFEEEWYDGPLYSFGLGPLILICWD